MLELMGLDGRYPVLHGAATELADSSISIDSEGVRFIIDEALRDDPRPLYVVCQGALTDMASALLLRPEIAERLTVV